MFMSILNIYISFAMSIILAADILESFDINLPSHCNPAFRCIAIDD